MIDPNDEFDFPKLASALGDAYAHRGAIPAAVDEAIRAAATERFARRRRLQLTARWGTGLAAGIAAAIVIMASLHRPPPLAPRGADHGLTMVDALRLAKRVAAKEAVDKSWDMNHDGVIDQKDVDAIASISVNLGPRVLGEHPLPTLQQLGITARHVERSEIPEDPGQIPSASSGQALRKLRLTDVTSTVSLAKRVDAKEVPQ